ncbi:uncharacterized protein LOC119980268 [Tripterygium wilfordii]|uniref:uncharacterized protein LOC119980268 n=1 Tax=Tripterygium wilfordii TaxID=458696 RepID=UPI0018F8360B|nr:uncharacterized protein LOC119980268 [Tripterygium wilfordii]
MDIEDLTVHTPNWDVLVSDSANNPTIAGRMVAKAPTPADFSRYEALALSDKVSELNVAAMKVVSVLATLPGGIANMAHNETAAIERAEAAALAKAKAEAELEAFRAELTERTEALNAANAKELKYRKEKLRLEAEVTRLSKVAEVDRVKAIAEGKALGVREFKASEEFKLTLRQEGYFGGRGAFKMARKALIDAGQDPSILDKLCPVLVGKDGLEESKEDIYAELARAEDEVRGQAEDEENFEEDFEEGDELPSTVDLTAVTSDEDPPRVIPAEGDSPIQATEPGEVRAFTPEDVPPSNPPDLIQPEASLHEPSETELLPSVEDI